ncbi:DedA family protein [Skermanella mucosa]|uniref:YqaA family protein n=1 Tax=Skermanella mucosa TaxID=1789672 RepID=UPI00192C06DC|nr:YqaA family protein [Skermanella mucosa]UEM22220.1 DedA family protein [Skermanella mucosa]
MAADLPAYAGLFAAALLAATILPAQSEILLATLLARGGLDPVLLVATASAGNVLGSVLNWLLGRFLIHLRHHRWFPLKPAVYDRAVGWYGRYGVWSLLFAWVPVVGDPLTVVAGALRVDLARFTVLVAIGKVGRYVFIALSTLWWTGGSG